MQLFGRPKRSCILREHSTKNTAVLKGKYFSCLVDQHLGCWGVARRVLCSKLQLHSQHSYKVNRFWIPCFMKGGIAAQGWVLAATTWCLLWKKETALRVPSMMRMSDSLCSSPALKVQVSKAKSHLAQSKLWVSHTLRREWPWPRASHCLGWRVEGSQLWVWKQKLWVDIII